MAALVFLFFLQSFIIEGFPLLYHALNDPKALPDDPKPTPKAIRDPCGFSFLVQSSIMKALDLLYHTLNNPKGLPDDPKPPPKPIRDPWGSAVIIDRHGSIGANLTSRHFLLASSTTEGKGLCSNRRPILPGPASNGSASSVTAYLAFVTASKERTTTAAHVPNMPSAPTTLPSTRAMTPTTPSPSTPFRSSPAHRQHQAPNAPHLPSTEPSSSLSISHVCSKPSTPRSASDSCCSYATQYAWHPMPRYGKRQTDLCPCKQRKAMLNLGVASGCTRYVDRVE
jgi:hypothetical protein